MQWFDILCKVSHFLFYHKMLFSTVQLMHVIQKTTRSTETVHTSAKASFTIVAIRIQSCDLDCHQKFNHLLIGPVPTFRENKISCKYVQKYLRKVANRQTNDNDYICSLVEVTNC